MDSRPIGIFDSGVGGVTVLRNLKNILPGENYIYFGDTGRVPYGSKAPEVVTSYSVEIGGFLREEGVKSLVIACNTASATAGKVLEDILDIPVISVIRPASMQAVASSKNRKIGVIGTRNTIQSRAHEKEIHSLNPDIEVYGMACPMLVPYIEEDQIDSPGLADELKRCLSPLLTRGIDTLILGCTHYPLIKDQISEIVGKEISLIDSGESTAREICQLLNDKSLLNPQISGQGSMTFHVTGGVQEFQDKLARFGLPGVYVHEVAIASLKQLPKVIKADQYSQKTSD